MGGNSLKTASALAAALSLCFGAYAADIDFDTGSPATETLSGLKISPDSAELRKAAAMTAFSRACLEADASPGKVQIKSVEDLFKAMALDPSSPELVGNLLETLIRTGSLKKNLDRLKGLAWANLDSLPLGNGASEALDAEGRRPEAVELLKAVVDKFKDSDGKDGGGDLENLVSRLALLQAMSGDMDGADATLTWAMENPSLGRSLQVSQAAMSVYSSAVKEASSSRSWRTLWLGRSDAEDYADKLAKSSASFVEEGLAAKGALETPLFQTAIGVLKESGRLPDARRILLKSLAAKPGDPATLSTLARVCFDMGDFSNACRYWDLALSRGLKPAANVYSAFALALKEAGRLTEAARILEWQLLIEPENKAASLQLALIYLETKDYAKCLARLSQLSKIPEALYLKALCLLRMKQAKAALSALSEYEKLNEGSEDSADAEHRLFKAQIAGKAGRPDVARAAIQPLLDRNPADAVALNFLGYTLADMNADLDLAEGLVRRALAVKPDDAAYLDSMAWVLFRKGRFKEAKVWIDKALKASGENPDGVLYDHAGDIEAALGDGKAALELWRKAFERPSEELDSSVLKAKIDAAGGFQPR